MPGFMIAERQTGQKPLPQAVVYTYTWDITYLIGERKDVYLRSASLPSYSFDIESVDTGHANYQFAKGIKWADMKVSFYDTEGLGQWLKSLSEKAWTLEKGIRPASEYMAETSITAYYYDNRPAHVWTLANSWIKSVSFSELTYETSGVNNANVVVAYSWASVEMY